MTNIGIVGIGFMGMTHYRAIQQIDHARVAAICSRDPKKRDGDWREIRGNFGDPGDVVDLGDIRRHESLEQHLADDGVDLVDVCLPNQHHAEAAIAALEAGKHVLVEKPIALTTEDADAMLAAAKSNNRLLMVAHVLPFFPEFRFAVEAVRSGKYGKLLAATFKRVISRPDWSSDLADAAKSGGPAIDLHIHDTHFIGLIAGVPRAVFATGFVEGDTVRHLTTQYLYGDGGPSIACSSGDLCQKGREFVHGFEIYLEQATLVHEAGSVPLTVLTADGETHQPELSSGDPVAAFADEIRAAVEGVTSGQEPTGLSGQLARDALVLCHRECESVRTGKILEV